jgi:hypothetical protein
VWLLLLLLLLLLLQGEVPVKLRGPSGLAKGSSSSVAAAPPSRQPLLKCRYKGCKLTFSCVLNQQRCHMSHLPSARSAATKVGGTVFARGGCCR